MTPENFAYWLQGFFEISQHVDHRQGLTPEAVQEIKNHLAEVFKKETTPVQFRLKSEDLDPIQEAIRRFNEHQTREKLGRNVYPGYWQPTITC